MPVFNKSIDTGTATGRILLFELARSVGREARSENRSFVILRFAECTFILDTGFLWCRRIIGWFRRVDLIVTIPVFSATLAQDTDFVFGTHDRLTGVIDARAVDADTFAFTDHVFAWVGWRWLLGVQIAR